MKVTDKILVTGSSGLIGSALIRRLQRQGFFNLICPSHAELELTNQLAVNNFFNYHRPQIVFHLAAKVGGIHANNNYPAQFIFSNTLMQTLVLNASHESGVTKLLIPGSACTYPKNARHPVEEIFLGTGPLEETNLAYAHAKLNGIIMAQSFSQEYGLNIVIPMPTNTYGIGDNYNPLTSHVIPALIGRMHAAKVANSKNVTLWGTGSPLREFIYSDDVADALIFLMTNYNTPLPINVGTMQEISIKNLAYMIKKIVGYNGDLNFDITKPNGSPRKVLDSTKLFALGWKPKTSLSEGLTKMYAAYLMSNSHVNVLEI